MPERKRPPDEPGAQSIRFIETAEKLGVNGRKFDRAFRKVVKPRRSKKPKP